MSIAARRVGSLGEEDDDEGVERAHCWARSKPIGGGAHSTRPRSTRARWARSEPSGAGAHSRLRECIGICAVQDRRDSCSHVCTRSARGTIRRNCKVLKRFETTEYISLAVMQNKDKSLKTSPRSRKWPKVHCVAISERIGTRLSARVVRLTEIMCDTRQRKRCRVVGVPRTDM